MPIKTEFKRSYYCMFRLSKSPFQRRSRSPSRLRRSRNKVDLWQVYCMQCNYDINRLTISATFYRELLEWWSKLREVEDPENTYKYILWNNRDIKIDGKSVFYKHFFDNNIIYTNHLLYDMTNIESFNVAKVTGLKNSNFLVWTGLRQSVPLKLRFHMPDVENIFDFRKF